MTVKLPTLEEQLGEAKPVPQGGAGDRKALFDEINKGEAITAGLRKAERKPKGVVDNQPPLEPKTKPKTQSLSFGNQEKEIKITGAPSIKYSDTSVFVENYVDNTNVVVNEATISQVVYIDKCMNSIINVEGKVKTIMLSHCFRVTLVFDTVISTVEAVSCKNLEIRTKNHAPSISLDKCEAVRVYLKKDLNTDIISSKVTELNISYETENGDYAKDTPITEQFITRWDPTLNRFVTKPLELFMP